MDRRNVNVKKCCWHNFFRQGNKTDLTKFRDMQIVARDRVRKLKTEGKSVGEIAASRPFADLEATWGKGFFTGDVFVQMVYSTL